MEDAVTKDDLRQFGMLLMDDIQKLLERITCENQDMHPEWLRSKAVRKLMDMSAGSLQNLRITGKVRYKKILGSYYYNKSDLQALFNE